MFTGIVQALGRVVRSEPRASGLRVTIDTGALAMDDVACGDSIAVNGACLTAIAIGPREFSADVSSETLACTTATGFDAGARVNLEKALRLADRLGGHLMTGHVDGVGTVLRCARDGDSLGVTIEGPAALARYVARKGSVAVDGVSLTVNAVAEAQFTVNLIPHTLEQTTLQHLSAGASVNLEIDLMARYAERLMTPSIRAAG